MVTAKDFIAWVYVPLREAWGYIYGTAGIKWTAWLQKSWSQAGHKNYEQTARYGAQWIGRMVCDCSGLLCWALKQLGVKDFVHQARYQYTDQCKAHGTMTGGKRSDGKQLLPGTAVFLKGDQDHIHHVGVYVGHGVCIEAKGTRWGVVTSAPDHWDHWGELKMIDYENAAELENEPAPATPERPDDTLGRAMVDNPGAWLNVRKGPGTDYPVLFRLEKGDIVDVLAIDDEKNWDQVRYGGRTGWASADYLRILDADPPADKPDGKDQDDPEESDPSDDRAQLIKGMREAIERMRTELQELEEEINELEGGY